MELKIGLKFLIIFESISFIKAQSTPIYSTCSDKYNITGICINVERCGDLHSHLTNGVLKREEVSICNEELRLVCCPSISQLKCRETLKYTRQATPVGLKLGRPASKFSYKNKCQHKNIGLIVGGTNAKVFEFPHQALLGKSVDNWKCGGSVVSENFIITAAHCVSGKVNPQFVKVGMIYLNQTDNKVSIHEIEEKIPHPSYNLSLRIHDIALVKLKTNIIFNEYVYPICLPAKLYAKDKAITTGFGKTDRRKGQSYRLLKVVLEKFSNEECQMELGISINNDSMMCYGHHTERKDSCGGDSGGPLQIYSDEYVECSYTLIGITSFGLKDCGTIGKPGVYANVFNYIDWIENIVWGHGEI